MQKKGWWKGVLVYLCITFFVVTLAFIGISFGGRSQPGLIEVGCSACLFIAFLHIIKRFMPQSMSIIVTILSILIVAILIFTNYSLQVARNRKYTFKELFIGDLLAKRLISDHKEGADKQLTKIYKDILPGEFTRTMTEKYTIESTFERPEKDLRVEPGPVSLSEPIKIITHKVKDPSFDMPGETAIYKLGHSNIEKLSLERVNVVAEIIEDELEGEPVKITRGYIQTTSYLPVDTSPSLLSLLPGDEERISAESPDLEAQPAMVDGFIETPHGNQIEEELQIP